MKLTNFMMERPCLVICLSYALMIIISAATLYFGLFALADIMDLDAFLVFDDKMVTDHRRTELAWQALGDQADEG